MIPSQTRAPTSSSPCTVESFYLRIAAPIQGKPLLLTEGKSFAVCTALPLPVTPLRGCKWYYNDVSGICFDVSKLLINQPPLAEWEYESRTCCWQQLLVNYKAFICFTRELNVGFLLRAVTKHGRGGGGWGLVYQPA